MKQNIRTKLFALTLTTALAMTTLDRNSTRLNSSH